MTPQKTNGEMVKLTPDEVITESLSAGMILSSISRDEIDIQIATARRFPRSIVTFKQQAREMACLDESTAGSMFYIVPRADKKIDGPSVRLAEIVASAWGNLRYGSRGKDIGATYVVAEGAAFDLEKNIACSVEVRRRIVDKEGRRYSDDMITMTMNAAQSIALRQAIFKVVPFAYVKDIYEEAKKCSVGKGMTLTEQRKKAVEKFKEVGIAEKDLLALAGKKGLLDITTEDLIMFRGIYTAIADGDTTVAEVLASIQPVATTTAGAEKTPTQPKKTLSEQLADKVREKAAAAAEKTTAAAKAVAEKEKKEKATTPAAPTPAPPAAAPTEAPKENK